MITELLFYSQTRSSVSPMTVRLLDFRASRETMASDPEGQLSDQSDIPANSEVSEVVINWVVSKDKL